MSILSTILYIVMFLVLGTTIAANLYMLFTTRKDDERDQAEHEASMAKYEMQRKEYELKAAEHEAKIQKLKSEE